MKTKFIVVFLVMFVLSCTSLTVIAPTPNVKRTYVYKELIYEGIWGTIYHAETRQCDATPTITGSGYVIDPTIASDLRIVAISHEMLNDMWRRTLIDTTVDNRFNGKIAYGDTIWIESPKDSLGRYIYPNINGYWIVQDTKNKRYKNSIDFLQTKHDWNLFNNDSMWNGRFDDLKIYMYHDRT
jgi:hypothetical protein